MKSLTLKTLKFEFSTLIGHVAPSIKSQFMVWLDEKVAEFKVNGHMKLDTSTDAPQWLRDYSMSLIITDTAPFSSESAYADTTPSTASVSPFDSSFVTTHTNPTKANYSDGKESINQGTLSNDDLTCDSNNQATLTVPTEHPLQASSKLLAEHPHSRRSTRRSKTLDSAITLLHEMHGNYMNNNCDMKPQVKTELLDPIVPYFCDDSQVNCVSIRGDTCSNPTSVMDDSSHYGPSMMEYADVTNSHSPISLIKQEPDDSGNRNLRMLLNARASFHGDNHEYSEYKPTRAEQMRLYRLKLKSDPVKAEEYKRKERERAMARRYRAKLKLSKDSSS